MKTFCAQTGAGVLLVAWALGCAGGSTAARPKFSEPMPVPPVLQPTASAPGEATYDLTPQEGVHAFFEGKPTPTCGYNGPLLGPTIRITRGDTVTMRVHNRLPFETTVHWRGVALDGASDGGPYQPIAAGADWTATFTVDQPAATLVYHPHPCGDTGRQVYLGLGGFLIVDDPQASALDLPKTYGVDDFPVVVQDRRFDADGALAYLTREADGEGMLGDHILVNGALGPCLPVPAAFVRLRLLNGSNARTYRFALSDGRTFHQIATDQGLIAAPRPLTELPLSPGERAEIVLDLRGDRGRELFLQSRAFQVPGEEGEEEEEGGNGTRNGLPFPVMKLRVGAPLPQPFQSLPAALAPVAAPSPAPGLRVRSIRFEDAGENTINGRTYGMDRVDEVVQGGDTEVWEVENLGPEPHSFDLHNNPFWILERSSGPVPACEQGWKEVVMLAPGEKVRLYVPFNRHKGRFVYHCGILEHMDMGMMATFDVQ